MILLCQLIIGHFLADYPLQGEFLAKAKNHRAPVAGVPFYHALIAHAAMHAGVVWYMTGNGALAIAEFCLHALIDYAKCDGRISFNTDQALHVICKAVYVGVLLWQT